MIGCSYYLGTSEGLRAHNWYITLNDLTAAKCLLQASPARGQFRIEFNPNRAGPTGMVALRRRVAETLTNYASLLFSEGGLTRLDIAVDVSPVELNYLKTFAKGLALSSSKYGSGGRHLETIYLGSERSKLQFAIYDKFHETSRNQAFADTVRFEARLRYKMSVSDITAIANPFERLEIYDFFHSAVAGQIPYKYQHFMDSVRQRGLHPALGCIPDSRIRRRYREYCGSMYDCEWWNPGRMWSRFGGEAARLQAQLL